MNHMWEMAFLLVLSSETRGPNTPSVLLDDHQTLLWLFVALCLQWEEDILAEGIQW